MNIIGCLPGLLIILPVLAQPIVMRNMEISTIRVEFMPEQIEQTSHTNDSELENAVLCINESFFTANYYIK